MIELDSLTKIQSGTTVVDAASLTVPAGEIAAIVGTSGAGKTTLLRMINRLVEPTSGRVRIDGTDASTIPPHLLRRRIGYVIQGHGLFPHRTVGQNIATVPRLLGWNRDQIRTRVDELLVMFQLDPSEFRDRLPGALSGGEQQRVGVARALAAAPAVLLMDEPFGALDPIIRAQAQRDLVDIRRRLKTTIVFVTHDMDEAIRLGDRIAVMDQGRVLQFGPPAELIAQPATPFVAQLIGAGDRALRILALKQVVEALEPGRGQGAPVAATMSMRDAYDECLWSGRTALPVVDEYGQPLGQVTRDRLAEHARPPG